MKVFAAALLALAFPATAWGEATLVTREVPLSGQRRLAAAASPERFNLVGLHWKGPGRVDLRVRRSAGWSSWQAVEAEAEDRPDRGSREASRLRGWRLGALQWTGEAQRLQVRVRGRVSRVASSA